MTVSNISIDKKLVKLIFIPLQHSKSPTEQVSDQKNIKNSKFRCWREQRLLHAAKAKVAKELDIVNFVRKQMVIDILLQLLFT